MTLYLEEEIHVDFDFDYEQVARDVINKSLELENFPYECEVSLTFVDEDNIKEINSDFRSVNSATDVLSFPMLDFCKPADYSMLEDLTDGSDVVNPQTLEVILGDIVLCLPRVLSQAEDYGHSVKREYAFLICHSMLHLLGYDHMNEDEARVMESHQVSILDALNIKRED